MSRHDPQVITRVGGLDYRRLDTICDACCRPMLNINRHEFGVTGGRWLFTFELCEDCGGQDLETFWGALVQACHIVIDVDQSLPAESWAEFAQVEKFIKAECESYRPQVELERRDDDLPF